MLDLKFIRENPEQVREAIKLKLVDLDLDNLLALDKQVRETITRLDKLREERNENAKLTGKASAADRPTYIDRGRALNDEIKTLEPQLRQLEEQLQDLLWLVPNIPSPDWPIGESDADNVEIKRWGEIPQFDFKPLDQVQILENHNWADFERVAKVSGSRSYALKNEMVMLEMALWRFALDKMRSKGFTTISVPALARESALFGTGHFPTGRDQVYYLPADDLYLSGTAEVVLNSLHSGEIMDENQLPSLYAGFSTCFRREAGSSGRDVRGLIRVHQFYKVEQYVLCRNDKEESAKFFDLLLNTSEEILQDLELPYRIVACCTGDMGTGKYRMCDLEAWVPSENIYRETHSCSELLDWQARRTNLRYRDSDGKVKFCYTLNNTALATPRILVPLLENHQQADGSIRIPTKLQPYLGGLEKIG